MTPSRQHRTQLACQNPLGKHPGTSSSLLLQPRKTFAASVRQAVRRAILSDGIFLRQLPVSSVLPYADLSIIGIEGINLSGEDAADGNFFRGKSHAVSCLVEHHGFGGH